MLCCLVTLEHRNRSIFHLRYFSNFIVYAIIAVKEHTEAFSDIFF